MNTNPKLQENLKLKKKALALLSKAIAKIILKFRLPRSEFINSLDENLVLQAKKQDPDASNVAIAIRTGIDRRYISKYLKGETLHSKPDKMTIILEDINWIAHKIYKSNKIPKTGPFRTFQSICEQRAHGTLTYKAILKEFINNKNLKDLGDAVELLQIRSKTIQDNANYSQLTANQIHRLITTIFYNIDIDNTSEKFVQRTIYSSQIKPSNFNFLHNDLKKTTDRHATQIDTILSSYEEDVNAGTYPEYGYSFLEYKIEK